MKGVADKREQGHLFIGNLATRWIGVGVELALHHEASLGRGGGDQGEDHRIAEQWLASPVLANPGKEAVFNLVPFARSWRKVADRDRSTRLIGQLLQFPFPQAHT